MGKAISLEQDSPEWLEFRSKRIGASEVSTILGMNEYQTPYQLWCLKTGRAKPEPMNDHMRRGKRLEPLARLAVEAELGFKLEARVMVDDEMDFFMASFDGINETLKLGWECKAPKDFAIHNSLQANGIPNMYSPQVQAQMYISGYRKWFFSTVVEKPSLTKNTQIAVNTIEVEANPFLQTEICGKVKRFWNLIVTDTPPPIKRDEFELRSDYGWQLACSDYIDIIKLRRDLEQKQLLAKDRLVRLMRTDKQKGCGVSVTRFQKMGEVDYKSITELKHIDLDKYRAPAKEVVQVRLLENEKVNEEKNV